MHTGALPVRYAKCSWSGLAGGRVESGGEDVGGAMVSGSGACCGATAGARIGANCGSNGNANGGGTLCGSTAVGTGSEISHAMPSAWCGGRSNRDRSMATGLPARPHVMHTSSPAGPVFTNQLSGRGRVRTISMISCGVLTLMSPIKIDGAFWDVMLSATPRHVNLVSSESLQLRSKPSNTTLRSEEIWCVFTMVIPCQQTNPGHLRCTDS